MDREYTEFIKGVILVVSVQQLEENLWAARTTLDGVPFETRSNTARHARQTLLLALSREIPDKTGD